MNKGTSEILMKVNMVSTYPPTKCGIAVYTEFLNTALKKSITVRRIRIKNPADRNLLKLFRLAHQSIRDCDILHIQYEQGLFGWRPTANIFPTLAPIFFLYLKMLQYLNRSKFPKVIVTFHETEHLNQSINILKKRDFLRIRFLLKNRILKGDILATKLINNMATRIIVHTNISKKQLTTVGFAPHKIDVVPTGAPKPAGKYIDKEISKSELALSGKKTILIFGFITLRRRYDLVLEVLKELKEDVVLLMVGEDHPSAPGCVDELKKVVKEFGLDKRVIFYGFVEDANLQKIFSATDLAIHPLTTTTASAALSILLANSVPTLTSDAKGFREIYEKYRCIELFSLRSKNDLYNKIVEILYSEEKQQKLKVAAKKYVEENSWEKVAGYTADVYLSALGFGHAHEDSTYEVPCQKDRIDYLKAHTSGIAIEIGCATGYVTESVGAKLGVDINPYRIATAILKHPTCKFMVGDGANLSSFIKERYDTVLLPEILEHVPFETAKKILLESLKVGKKVLITLPNASKKMYDKNLVENPEHKWLPTKENVKKLLEGENYKIEYTKNEDFILIEVHSNFHTL